MQNIGGLCLNLAGKEEKTRIREQNKNQQYKCYGQSPRIVNYGDECTMYLGKNALG